MDSELALGGFALTEVNADVRLKVSSQPILNCPRCRASTVPRPLGGTRALCPPGGRRLYATFDIADAQSLTRDFPGQLNFRAIVAEPEERPGVSKRDGSVAKKASDGGWKLEQSEQVRDGGPILPDHVADLRV